MLKLGYVTNLLTRFLQKGESTGIIKMNFECSGFVSKIRNLQCTTETFPTTI